MNKLISINDGAVSGLGGHGMPTDTAPPATAPREQVHKPCLRASTAEITGWLCADMAERVAADQ